MVDEKKFNVHDRVYSGKTYSFKDAFDSDKDVNQAREEWKAKGYSCMVERIGAGKWGLWVIKKESKSAKTTKADRKTKGKKGKKAKAPAEQETSNAATLQATAAPATVEIEAKKE